MLESGGDSRVDLNDFRPLNPELAQWVNGIFTRIANTGNNRDVRIIRMPSNEGSRGIENYRRRDMRRMSENLVHLTESDIVKHLKRMKNGKQPGLSGLDGIRA